MEPSHNMTFVSKIISFRIDEGEVHRTLPTFSILT